MTDGGNHQTLGNGAFSVVYHAYDPRLQREVALKVPHTGLNPGSDSAERFEREARAVAQLRHPNIVQLLGVGERDGQRYIEVELIRGNTLEARLQRDEPVDWLVIAGWVRKLADALHYAHSKGIVHRDVKPSNILIDESEEPQLTDFGLARREESEPSITLDGQILGTPAYMSPEQAIGNSHQADARSDVYSLGVVFYRMLTGRLPFDFTDSARGFIHELLHTEPHAPHTLKPLLPRDLETICLKAIAKEPADRFQSAAAFADELRRWLADEPLTIRPPTTRERTRRWARRNRLAARVAAVAALLLLVVSGISGMIAWVQFKQLYEARARAILEAETKAELQVRALMDTASQRLRIPTLGRRSEAQAILRKIAEPRGKIPAGPKTERLDLEIRSVFARTLGVFDVEVVDSTLPDTLPAAFHSDWRVSLHPDGEAMVIGTHRGPVRWVRGQMIELPPDELDPKQPRPRVTYSPDGKYLAFAPSTGGLELWDEQVTRSVAELEPRDNSPVLVVGFDRQVRTLWACRADGQVRSWSLPDFQPRASWQVAQKTVRETRSPINAAAFNTDSTKLAAGDKLGRVLLYESSGKLLRELTAAESDVESLAWSPDSRLIAVGTKDSIVQLWRVDGVPMHRLTASGLEVSSIQFHPDGRWVLAGARGGIMKMWDVATGEELLTGFDPPWGFSRNGQRFAVGGIHRAAFCDLVVPQAVQRLTGHRAQAERIVWSRDNKHLVSMDASFEVRVWDVPKGRIVDSFRPPRGDFFARNASVALDDTGAQVGYASGGREQAHALIRNVSTHNAVVEWELPGGFERMSFYGGRFLLVREELQGESRQSVAYELAAGQQPKELQVVRPSEPGEAGFFDHELTHDGRYYLWVGPRRPSQNYRVEVREVATGRLVRRVPRPEKEELQASFARLSPDGRGFWIRVPVGGYLHYGMADGKPAEHVSIVPVATSSDSKWRAFAYVPDELRAVYRLSVSPNPKETDWLEFGISDLSQPNDTAFSGDGRYLAWASENGTITVADLPAVRKEIAEFERTLAPNQ